MPGSATAGVGEPEDRQSPSWGPDTRPRRSPTTCPWCTASTRFTGTSAAARWLNPVPENHARRGALAHRSPLETPDEHRRGRLRPKLTARQPRAIPDGSGHELFAQMGCDRDRALLACYVSSGARASGTAGRRHWATSTGPGPALWVISKGTRARQPVPASPEALRPPGRYLDEAGLPARGSRSGGPGEVNPGR